MSSKKRLATLTDLEEAFIQGYVNASSSLEALRNAKVQYRQFHSGSYRLNQVQEFDHDLLSSGRDMVVTTEIFGDLVGKSYLLISTSEFESLTRDIPDSEMPGINMKVEFVKELDNILSASVITELSNRLRIRAFGDVPIVASESSASIGEVIFDDFRSQTDAVYVTAIYFSFENETSIMPRFVWVVNRNDFEGSDDPETRGTT
jgi:chemotaxis protein CheY-P-specific phosphatase CheC